MSGMGYCGNPMGLQGLISSGESCDNFSELPITESMEMAQLLKKIRTNAATHNECAHYIRTIMLRYTNEFPIWADNFIYDIAADFSYIRKRGCSGR